MKTGISILLFIFLRNIADPQAGSKTLLPKDFKSRLEKMHGVLIDVRSPEEFIQATITGAININLTGNDFNSRISSLDKGKTYFLFDGTGVRSSSAMEEMKKAGFTKLFELDGGLNNWIKYDLPVD